MITTNDSSYKITKVLLKKKKKLNSIFSELADWINETYSVNVINICYEIIGTAGKKRPRLEVVFESRDEVEVFNEEGGYNYDSLKQSQIIDQFVKILKENEKGFLIPKSRKVYDIDNIFVIFSAFAPIAMSEANNKVSLDDIHTLKDRYIDDNVWEIANFFEGVTLFFYTEEQAKNNKSSELKDKIEREYYELLMKHDEFGYYGKYGFKIMVDSKENLDKNYEGNWYYYYK